MAGAGAFEVALAHELRTKTKKLVSGRAKLGIEAFAEALMGFPKILAENSGHEGQEAMIKLQVSGLLDCTGASSAAWPPKSFALACS
jgi:chaperonin GroEL (HSP60 family)